MGFGDFFADLGLGFMIKFIILFALLVLFPIFKLAVVEELTFLYKVMFMGAGGVGLWLALTKGTMKGFSGRRR